MSCVASKQWNKATGIDGWLTFGAPLPCVPRSVASALMPHQRGGAATSSVVRLGRAPQAEHRLDGPLVRPPRRAWRARTRGPRHWESAAYALHGASLIASRSVSACSSSVSSRPYGSALVGKPFSAVLPHHRPDQSRVDGQMAEHVAAVPPVECAVGSDALLDKVAGLLEICQRPCAGDVHSRSVLLYDLRRVVERHVPALLGSFDRTPAATEVDRLNLPISRATGN